MNEQELKIIADMTITLTEMRKKSCDHLCIENFAPELFEKLLRGYHNSTYISVGKQP